ncbi:MAG: RDD family protein [Coprobacillus sp.]
MKKKKKQVLSKMDIIEIRARRFAALVIDWYLTNMLAVIPITFYFRGGDYLKPHMFELQEYSFYIGLLLGLYAIVVGIIYYTVIPTFVWKGQTLGKKLCKVKVVQEDETDITYKTMFIREMLGATLLEGGIVMTAAYLRKLLPLFNLAQFVTPLQYIAYALTLLSIAYAYFKPKSQAFHDKVAKTIVIKK